MGKEMEMERERERENSKYLTVGHENSVSVSISFSIPKSLTQVQPTGHYRLVFSSTLFFPSI